MWIASNRLRAATAGMLALAGVALAADTGGAPEGQPTSPDSPTMAGPDGREPGAPPGDHHRNHE